MVRQTRVTEQENKIRKAAHIVDTCHIFDNVKKNVEAWQKMSDLIYTQKIKHSDRFTE